MQLLFLGARSGEGAEGCPRSVITDAERDKRGASRSEGAIATLEHYKRCGARAEHQSQAPLQ